MGEKSKISTLAKGWRLLCHKATAENVRLLCTQVISMKVCHSQHISKVSVRRVENTATNGEQSVFLLQGQSKSCSPSFFGEIN